MKHTIRQQILRQRQHKQTTSLKHTKDVLIFARLVRHKTFKKAQTVFCYVSKQDEVDTLKLIERYRNKKRIIVPKVRGAHIQLFHLTHTKDLQIGAFGILEPMRHCAKHHYKDLDLAIIPGVAFDMRGHRIGYGKGFFDRFLKKLKCPKIGLAYEFQIVDKIPETTYDVPVDYIITEKRIIECT